MPDLPMEVRHLRKALKQTQAEFGDQVGADQSSVSRWERGDVRPEPQHILAMKQLAALHKRTFDVALFAEGEAPKMTAFWRALRISLDMSEEQFAELAELDVDFLREIEKYNKDVPEEIIYRFYDNLMDSLDFLDREMIVKALTVLHQMMVSSGLSFEALTAIESITSKGLRVPVIALAQAGILGDSPEAELPISRYNIVVTETTHSERSFAFMILDDSMLSKFRKSDVVIIDPETEPFPGDFVVAKLESDPEAIFRKFRPRDKDPDGHEIIELVPLNEDWPTLRINGRSPGTIVGVMIEHRSYRG